jgi:ribulose-phosphate 3-epimerase
VGGASPSSALARLASLAPTLSVGVLTADLLALGADVARLDGTGVGMLHVDVMDGCFTPMMTVGPPLVKALRTPLFKDVHLMLQRLGTMQNANDPARGIVRGLALNPGTPIEAIVPLLDEIDLLLLLAINPGWGGQKFLPATMGRIASARRLLDGAGGRVLLAVDGGITRDNVGRLAGTGVDVVVTGSAVFDGKAPAENARAMLAALRAA